MTPAGRCIEWMNDVIEVHMDTEYGTRPTAGEHLEAIEDAEFIIECIERTVPKRTHKDEWRRIQCSNGHNLPVVCRDSKMPYCPFCGQAIDWSEE